MRPLLSRGPLGAALTTILALSACGTSSPPAPSTPVPAASSASRSLEATGMNIELTVGGTTVRAVLDDNPTTRDLLSLLPLKLPLKDFGGSEKIAYPPRRLTTDAAPAAATGRTGDVAYYAPWGNLAIFYHDGPRADGLIILGRLTPPGDVSALTGDITLTRTP